LYATSTPRTRTTVHRMQPRFPDPFSADQRRIGTSLLLDLAAVVYRTMRRVRGQRVRVKHLSPTRPTWPSFPPQPRPSHRSHSPQTSDRSTRKAGPLSLLPATSTQKRESLELSRLSPMEK